MSKVIGEALLLENGSIVVRMFDSFGSEIDPLLHNPGWLACYGGYDNAVVFDPKEPQT